MNQATRLFTRNTTIILLIIVFASSCGKDCLEKDKCYPSSYTSSYLIEQSSIESTGTTYYIDSEDGNKDNDGKSTSTAFKEMKQLSDIEFKPGDQILFKRNQYHFGEFMLQQSGTPNARIVIADYGAGALPLLKTKTKKDGHTLYLFNSDYVTIQNLNIQGGAQAILLDGADYSIVQGCRIGEKSESGLRATGRYSETSGSNFGIIRHCLIYSGLSGETGDLQGTDGVQLMDGASEWHIYENEFKAWAHSAMSIKPIYTALNSNNNVIEHNLFDCSDINYMRALDVTGPENRASFNVFQKNIIKNQTVTSHLHGNDNIVAYNIFTGLKESSASNQPWAIDFHVFIGNSGGTDRTEYVCFNNKIYNNVFYNYENGVGIRFLNSKDGTSNDVHDNEVINNIFYNIGASCHIDAEPTNNSIKNNLFYSSSTFIIEDLNYTILTFSAPLVDKGYTIENNIDGDPLFINPASNNFSVTSGSTVINNGLNVGLLSDFNNDPLNGLPDIGAFEF